MAITAQQDHKNLLPIRKVAQITGVNPVTLRAWERRYGLIQPIRTEKGHRLYTDDDVALIKQLTQWLESGISISQASQRLTKGEVTKDTGGGAFDPWAAFFSRIVNAVQNFDLHSLESAYNEALAMYPMDMTTEKLLAPLLVHFGDSWENQLGSVAEEHFFTTYLRNKVGSWYHHQSLHTRGPNIVLACVPEERHELALLLFGLSLLNRGYRVTLLGADVPISELITPIAKTKAVAVVLSSTNHLPLNILKKNLPSALQDTGIPFFIGGNAINAYRDDLSALGLIPLSNHFRDALDTINSTIGHQL